MQKGGLPSQPSKACLPHLVSAAMGACSTQSQQCGWQLQERGYQRAAMLACPARAAHLGVHHQLARHCCPLSLSPARGAWRKACWKNWQAEAVWARGLPGTLASDNSGVLGESLLPFDSLLQF